MTISRPFTFERLSRITSVCKILSHLCRIALFVMAIWCVYVTTLMIYSISSSSLSGTSLLLGACVPLVYAIYGINFCMIPWVLGNMLDDISKSRTPFTTENSKRLRLLSLSLLAYSLLEGILAVVDSQFVISIQDHLIEVGDFLHDFAANAETTLDLFPLLMAAIFFALSYVFQYGVLLQQESDETL